jgi:hypothetical protein
LAIVLTFALPLAFVFAEFVLVADGPAHPYECDMIAANAIAIATVRDG